VGTSSVLFSKLEDELIENLSQKYSGTQKERLNLEKEGKKMGSDAEKESVKHTFAELDLRVAEIVKIERHPKADKLYIETLDIAGEERSIVSGLVPFYKEEELLNKHIIIVYNLKSAKLRGIESRGMLLAASFKDAEGKETVEVLDAGDSPAGTRITLEGSEMTDMPGIPPLEIDIDAFLAVPVTVRDHAVIAEGKNLTVAGNPIVTKAVVNGEVH
jgi:methionyl-tRNA synthetase